MAGSWTNDQTAALIELYQGEPTLYSVSSPEYHNKFSRQTALEKIVEGLQDVRPNSKVTEIKAKINGLRARFNAELAKLRYKPTGSGAEISKITFSFFEKMLFLHDHLVSRKSYNNLAQGGEPSSQSQGGEPSSQSQSWVDSLEVEEESFNEDEDQEESHVTIADILSPSGLSVTPNNSTAPGSPAVSEGRPKKKRKTETSQSNEDFLLKAGSALELLSQNTQPQKDEWEVFGSFVASSIKNLNNKKNRIRCKHEILKLIMEYEEAE